MAQQQQQQGWRPTTVIVAGETFMTTLETLCQYPHSQLALLFSPPFPLYDPLNDVHRMPPGVVAHPAVFGILLDFLRCGGTNWLPMTAALGDEVTRACILLGLPAPGPASLERNRRRKFFTMSTVDARSASTSRGGAAALRAGSPAAATAVPHVLLDGEVHTSCIVTCGVRPVAAAPRALLGSFTPSAQSGGAGPSTVRSSSPPGRLLRSSAVSSSSPGVGGTNAASPQPNQYGSLPSQQQHNTTALELLRGSSRDAANRDPGALQALVKAYGQRGYRIVKEADGVNHEIVIWLERAAQPMPVSRFVLSLAPLNHTAPNPFVESPSWFECLVNRS